MSPTALTLTTILTGVGVVLAGILIFRLHAFLALTLGALTVAALTPRVSIESFLIEKSASVRVTDENLSDDRINLPVELLKESSQLSLMAFRPNPKTGGLDELGSLTLERAGESETARILKSDISSQLQPGDVLTEPSHVVSARKTSKSTIASRVTQAFGNTCAGIGLLIAMASIVGKCLLESGAADRIVRSSVRVVGEKRAPVAFLGSGFLLGVPVFFDTVFYLMIPLGKALYTRTGRNYLLYVLTIVSGATMAHSLVPPTPGPLLVATELGVDLGLMILAGSVVGIITAGCGFIWATVANRIWELPLRDTPDMSKEDLAQIAEKSDSELPPLWLSLLPILLPVVLIGGYTLIDRSGIELSPAVAQLARTLGDKNIALIVAAIIGVFLVIRQNRPKLDELQQMMQPALASAGIIILITAAGGAFGKVLQQTGVSNLIRDLPDVGATGLVVLAFLITTGIRTAQGSATVAMITSVGILSGLADSLPFDPVWLALAIGCGSKPFAWMADSGFWVITRMSGMTEVEGLKFVTPLSAVKEKSSNRLWIWAR